MASPSILIVSTDFDHFLHLLFTNLPSFHLKFISYLVIKYGLIHDVSLILYDVRADMKPNLQFWFLSSNCYYFIEPFRLNNTFTDFASCLAK